MDGTPPATNDGGDEECKTAAAVDIAAVVIAAPAFSSDCLLTGSSDTADKTKPEPYVQREIFWPPLTRGCLLTAGVNIS